MVDIVEPVVGKAAKDQAHRQIHRDAMNSVSWVPSGFTSSDGGGLNLSVAAGRAFLGGATADRSISTTLALTANATNFVFVYIDDVLDDEIVYFRVNTTGVAPAEGPSHKIAEVVTGASSITTITDKRRTVPGVAGELLGERAAAANAAFGAQVVADTSRRFQLLADGKMEWGPGNAALDTNLYRNAANVLKTDDDLEMAALRIAATVIVNGSRNLVGLNGVAQALSPEADGTRDMGSGGLRWRDAYLSGTLVGPTKTREVFLPSASFLLDTGTPAHISIGDGLRVWDFDADSTERISSYFLIPSDWNGGNLTVKIFWKKSTSGTGAVVWQYIVRQRSDNESVFSAEPETTVQQSFDPGGNVNLQVDAFTTTIPAGETAILDLVMIAIARLGTDAGDTYALDAQLHAVVVEFTAKVDP